ncbi:hypothetical protein [Roseospira navarrensis]|uniref:Uncharacterized protein n=1 Tax=Roseospira navarrensis TaxID=140058 RepID=A0A7X1ZGG7_9PROT|nr:hypothetical protein [Roseospira navarrensis]MQX36962.1 hypothetical protein [Roseospira navarrensis]
MGDTHDSDPARPGSPEAAARADARAGRSRMADFAALEAGAPLALESLSGLTLCLEYAARPGALPDPRWVTLERTRGSPPHALQAYCWHEGRSRTFRFTDIAAVRDGADAARSLADVLALFGVATWSRSRSLVPARDGGISPPAARTGLPRVRPDRPSPPAGRETSRVLEILGLFWIDLLGVLVLTGFYYDFKGMLAITLLLALAVAPVAFLVGMVQPRWVLPRRAAPTRLSVAGLYMTALAVAVVLLGLAFSGEQDGPPDDPVDPGAVSAPAETPGGARKARDP